MPGKGTLFEFSGQWIAAFDNFAGEKIKMNKLMLVTVTSIFSSTVWAADFVDTARVISSAPIYERVSEPKQECWNEIVETPGYTSRAAPAEDRSLGGTVVGGVVGGLVGHQVGKGSGNTAATVAGTIAGAIIGDRMANNPSNAQTQTSMPPQAREERHCRQIESFRDVIRGYNVVYRYKGQDISTRLPYQPGDTLRVAISVVEGNGADIRDSRVSERKEYRGKERRRED